MKNNLLIRGLSILFLGLAVFFSCTKETVDVRLEPTLETAEVLNVQSDAATVVGFVIASGEGLIEKGICYNTQPGPTVDHNKVAYTGDAKTATFNVTLTGLNYTTKYYARAYAIGENGIIYGKEFSFTTTPAIPIVNTAAVSNVASSSAQGGGVVTDAGGAEITAKGVVYGTTPNPTLTNNFTTDGGGVDEFTSSLIHLAGSTTYYVRAYATSSAGTGYGPELQFTTLAPILATIETSAVRNITGTTAQSGGEILDDGGAAVTARGVVYSTTPNPTTADSKTEDGVGRGEFVSNLTNLTGLTTYYLRAYATNSVGTVYGDVLTFTTLVPIRTWYLPGNYVEASYPGSGFADWSPDKSPIIMSREATPDDLEGYVYMANANNMFKINANPNWDGPNYGDGGPGQLDPNGGDISLPKGYYKFNVNAITLAYTAVNTNWGVVGSATPGSWNTDSPLQYYPALRTWMGGVSLVDGEFKFRANNDWGLNYGSSAGDNTLNHDGSNIPISVAGDYFFILDLSQPFDYTYSANRWALIGDATPGGWGSDTFMSWDAATQSMKITVNLLAGEFKFRANGGWDVNLGGTTGNLTFGGGNIPVSEAGNYTIHLFPRADGGTFTITKN